MAGISAKSVMELRAKTSAGMADCKKAIEATGGNMERAVAWLREKGVASASKRADREAKEGAISVSISQDQKRVSMIELNCETDFVAKGYDFVKIAKELAEVALQTSSKSVEELSSQLLGDSKVESIITSLGAVLGEKIVLNRVVFCEASTGIVVPYIHLGSKLASIVELEGDGAGRVGRDIAMQIAAYNPIAVSRENVSIDEIQKEVDILRNQAINEGKPPQVVEKIVTGRLEKHYQETVLLEQNFVKDNTTTVKDFIIREGGDIKIKSFVRLQVGEK